METKISVLLADPGEQYRAAYSKAIGRETDMELVAQTDNGLRAEELITKFQPDVVVLDLVLPNLDGLSLLTHLRACSASARRPGRISAPAALVRSSLRRSPSPRSRASSPTLSTRSACPRTSRATSTCARRSC